RLRFGEHVLTIVERLYILDGDWPRERALVCGTDGERDLAAVDLSIDRNPLLQCDRILHARLQYPDFAESRSCARPAKFNRNNGIAVLALVEVDVGDSGRRLQIAKPHDHRDRHPVDGGEL